MTQENGAKKVYDILKSFSTAMVVTLGNRPAARPMHVAQVREENGQVWFLAGQHGGLAEDLERDGEVLLVFQNDTSAYLSVRGRARVDQDRSKIEQLWKEPYKVWFPEGPADPEIALIGVDLAEAEYWDNRGLNKLEYWFEAAKAYVQGRTPEGIDEDHHARAIL